MSDFDSHIDAIQNLARAVIEISQVDVPELEVTDEMIIEEEDSSWYELEQDEAWWNAWCEIYDIVVEKFGSPDIPDNQIRPEVEPHRQYDSVRVKNQWISLRVSVYADGHVRVLAEYNNGDDKSWAILFDSDASEADAIDIGREVASAEQTIIALNTGSCAETLDYWQTQLSPAKWTQRRWSDVRGVGRQTVSDRKNAAEETLYKTKE